MLKDVCFTKRENGLGAWHSSSEAAWNAILEFHSVRSGSSLQLPVNGRPREAVVMTPNSRVSGIPMGNLDSVSSCWFHCRLLGSEPRRGKPLLSFPLPSPGLYIASGINKHCKAFLSSLAQDKLRSMLSFLMAHIFGRLLPCPCAFEISEITFGHQFHQHPHF